MTKLTALKMKLEGFREEVQYFSNDIRCTSDARDTQDMAALQATGTLLNWLDRRIDSLTVVETTRQVRGRKP